jgi:hypothetical protein
MPQAWGGRAASQPGRVASNRQPSHRSYAHAHCWLISTAALMPITCYLYNSSLEVQLHLLLLYTAQLLPAGCMQGQSHGSAAAQRCCLMHQAYAYTHLTFVILCSSFACSRCCAGAPNTPYMQACMSGALHAWSAATLLLLVWICGLGIRQVSQQLQLLLLYAFQAAVRGCCAGQVLLVRRHMSFCAHAWAPSQKPVHVRPWLRCAWFICASLLQLLCAWNTWGAPRFTSVTPCGEFAEVLRTDGVCRDTIVRMLACAIGAHAHA